MVAKNTRHVTSGAHHMSRLSDWRTPWPTLSFPQPIVESTFFKNAYQPVYLLIPRMLDTQEVRAQPLKRLESSVWIRIELRQREKMPVCGGGGDRRSKSWLCHNLVRRQRQPFLLSSCPTPSFHPVMFNDVDNTYCPRLGGSNGLLAFSK